MADRSERLWGVQDVAGFLGVPTMTIYHWRTIKYGPPGVRVGRYLRYRPDDVHAWLAAQAERQAR